MNFSFFSKNNIGLDIADRSIEVVELSKINSIAGKARVELAPGIIERGRIQDREKLSEITRSLFQKAKIKDLGRKTLFFGLPESQTFIHIFEVEKKEADMEEVVRNELRAVIPIEFNSAAYGFTVSGQKFEEKFRVAAIAAERDFLVEWKKFLEDFGFEKVLIGAETFASYIGLGVKSNLLPVCVADIGSILTMVSVYDAQGICFASSAERAGDFATKEAAEAVGLSLVEAEKIKRQSGISDNNKKIDVSAEQGFDNVVNLTVQNKIINGKSSITAALKTALSQIILNVKNDLRYCQERRGINVSNILLVGGTSRMPGFVEFFKEQTGLNVAAGDCSYLFGAENALYTEAVGLALYDKNKQSFPVFDRGLSEENNEAQNNNIIRKENNNMRLMPPEEIREFCSADDENVAEAKFKKQKTVLLIIVLVGVIVLAAAFWYRAAQDKKRQAEFAAGTENFSFIESLPLAIPVAVDAGEEAADRVKGMLITDRIQMIGDRNEAIQTSKLAMAKQLSNNETFWEEPIAVSSADSATDIAGDKAIIDYTIRWLVYDEAIANKLFTAQASLKMQNTGVKYSISNIEKKSVEKTENKNIYLLRGIVTAATDKKADVLFEQKKEDEPAPTSVVSDESKIEPEDSDDSVAIKPADEFKRMITVQKTETGWLNVRKTPGTAAEIVKKINVGETYEVLAEDGDWLQLKLDDELSGWAAARYLK